MGWAQGRMRISKESHGKYMVGAEQAKKNNRHCMGGIYRRVKSSKENHGICMGGALGRLTTILENHGKCMGEARGAWTKTQKKNKWRGP
jgi:hypothetical protein